MGMLSSRDHLIKTSRGLIGESTPCQSKIIALIIEFYGITRVMTGQRVDGTIYLYYMKKLFLLILLVVVAVVLYFYISDTDLRTTIQKIDSATCSLRGGSMIIEGCGIANCTQKCAVRYSDGGKSCANSDQCSHNCVTNDARLPEPMSVAFGDKSGLGILEKCTKLEKNVFDCQVLNLQGKCEIQRPSNCENRWELNDGVVKPNFSNCKI